MEIEPSFQVEAEQQIKIEQQNVQDFADQSSYAQTLPPVQEDLSQTSTSATQFALRPRPSAPSPALSKPEPSTTKHIRSYPVYDQGSEESQAVYRAGALPPTIQSALSPYQQFHACFAFRPATGSTHIKQYMKCHTVAQLFEHAKTFGVFGGRTDDWPPPRLDCKIEDKHISVHCHCDFNNLKGLINRFWETAGDDGEVMIEMVMADVKVSNMTMQRE